MLLKNHVALVTGASSGIGRAIALRLAREGAGLCLVGRRPEVLNEIAEHAREISPLVLVYKVDLEADREIRELPALISIDLAHIDILVHSAGIISLGRIDEAAIQEFDLQYKINLHAPWLLTQAVLPMLRASQGQVVFINSIAGLNARAGVGQYAATKHALKAVADSLREELNPEGVRVLSLFAGRTATPMQIAVHKKEKKPYYAEDLLQSEDIAEMVLAALILPRTAEVTDISIRPFRKPRVSTEP